MNRDGIWHFPKLGDDEFMHSVNAWHGFVANMTITVAVFHSAAAFFHHYMIKDNVLWRMWPRCWA
jgi:cytochrome b561